MYEFNTRFARKATLSEMMTLYGILKKCNRFSLTNGTYKIIATSILGIMSMVSFKDGFDVHIESDDKLSFGRAKESLKELCGA